VAINFPITKTLKRLLSIALFLLAFNQAEASHIVGAEMTYTCIGPNTYEITLNIYWDCGAIATLENSYDIDYSSISCGQSGIFTVTQTNPVGVEITPICSSVQSTCSGGAFPGIKKFEYKGTVVLPMACTDWLFGWGDCCRDNSINTIVNPNFEGVYVEALLNDVDAPCNNSPVFSDDPVTFICQNQLNAANLSAVDSDGDSLNYSLTDPN